MPIHQVLMAGKATYVRGSELLYTSATRYIYYQAWFEGIVQTTNFTAASGDTTHLYNFSSSNTPSIDTGLAPPRLFLSRISPKLTPPGDGVYMRGDFADGKLYKRDNSTGAYTTAVGGNVNASDVYGTWNDDAAELVVPYTAIGGLISYTSIDWGALTYTRDTTKYSAIPGSGSQSLQIVRNGSLVSNRMYVTNVQTGQVGWAHTSTGAYTELVQYDNAVGVGVICASNYLGTNPRIVTQRGTTNEGNVVDVWDTSGSLLGSITLGSESTTTYNNLTNWVCDYVNNFAWCRNTASSTRHLYVLNLNNYSVRDIYAAADLPNGTANTLPIPGAGSPLGGIYAVHAPAGTYTTIYKIG